MLLMDRILEKLLLLLLIYLLALGRAYIFLGFFYETTFLHIFTLRH
jgi:hypothetical protein